MSSSQARRFKRKMEQDIKKGHKKANNHLAIPTEQDVQEYIDNKVKQMKNEPNKA